MENSKNITYEAYMEQKLHEVKVCFICGKLIYKRKKVFRVGNKYICEDCLKDLKMALKEIEEITR